MWQKKILIRPYHIFFHPPFNDSDLFEIILKG